jgi:hypothetical protein
MCVEGGNSLISACVVIIVAQFPIFTLSLELRSISQ